MKVTVAMIQALAALRPWLRFVAVSGILATVVVMVLSAIRLSRGVGELTTGEVRDASVDLIVGGTFLVNAILTIYPMAKLMALVETCKQVEFTRSMSSMALVMGQHRRFWKSWGPLTVVAMGLNLLVALVLWFGSK